MSHLSSIARHAGCLRILLLLALGTVSVACTGSDDLDTVRTAQAAGRYAETVEPLRELLAQDRGNPEINYRYGLALAQTGNRGLAEWSLRAAMEDDEWRLAAGRLLAFGEMLTENYPPAIEILDGLIEEHPEDVELVMMRANARAHSRANLEAALEDADRVFELSPDNLDAFEPRILALLGLERAEEAGQAIDELGRRISENAPESRLAAWHCATAALFAFESGDQELALERWNDCTKRFPGDEDVASKAIAFHDGRREFERSREILARAVEENPGSRSLRVLYAGRLRMTGQSERAAEVLRRGAESGDPAGEAMAWYDLAKHYQAVGNDAEAVASFERAMEHAEQANASLPQMKLEWADTLLLAGQIDRAEEVAETISVPAYRAVIRARAEQERGNPEEALEHFDESFRLWPNNPWTRYYAAIAHESLGDFDAAIESYRYSIRIAPGATDARQRLARLHLAEGNPQQAIHILRLMIDQEPLDWSGELLSFEIWGVLGHRKAIIQGLRRAKDHDRAVVNTALAAAARGLGQGPGAEAAVEFIRSAPDVGLSDPAYADTLLVLVQLSAGAGLPGARAEVRTALAAHPDAPALHVVDGVGAELAGELDAARAAYERALESMPNLAEARLGLCRIAAAREDPRATVGACEAALALRPGSPEASLLASEALQSLGRQDEADLMLEQALSANPYESSIASALASALGRSNSPDTVRIKSLEARASRFARQQDPSEHGDAPS